MSVGKADACFICQTRQIQKETVQAVQLYCTLFHSEHRHTRYGLRHVRAHVSHGPLGGKYSFLSLQSCRNMDRIIALNYFVRPVCEIYTFYRAETAVHGSSVDLFVILCYI